MDGANMNLACGKNKTLTLDRLKTVLDYCEDSGVFTWRAPTSPRTAPGARAGSMRSNGYRKVCIDGQAYAEHRLAWFYVHGSCPAELDHINGCRDDNRLSNLREATHQENMFNKRVMSHSRTGIKGVSKNKNGTRWSARLRVGKLTFYLGSFKNPTSAAHAYAEASRRIHSEFGRTK